MAPITTPPEQITAASDPTSPLAPTQVPTKPESPVVTTPGLPELIGRGNRHKTPFIIMFRCLNVFKIINPLTFFCPPIKVFSKQCEVLVCIL